MATTRAYKGYPTLDLHLVAMGLLSFGDKVCGPRVLQSASSPVEDERAWSSGSFKPSPLRASESWKQNHCLTTGSSKEALAITGKHLPAQY
jgi:hypothetical protein